MSKTTDADREDPAEARPMRWYAQDASFATDPRIGMLSEIAQLTFIRANCAVAQRVAPCTDERFAWWTRVTLERLIDAKRELLEAGLIDGRWVPTEWSKYQQRFDGSNAERQRRHRERQKKSEDRNVTNVTSSVTTGQDKTGHTDRTDRTSPAVTQGGNGQRSGPSVPARSPRNREADSRERFERVKQTVVDALGAGISPDDTEGLARATRHTVGQVRAAVEQLRADNQLRKPKRGPPTETEIAAARLKAVEENRTTVERLGLGDSLKAIPK